MPLCLICSGEKQRTRKLVPESSNGISCSLCNFAPSSLSYLLLDSSFKSKCTQITKSTKKSNQKMKRNKRFLFQYYTYETKNTHPFCSVCGKPTELIPNYQRIIGGSEAPQNTIPWQVMLSVGSQRAGGMVISDRWILTAAHVLESQGVTTTKENVRVGQQSS